MVRRWLIALGFASSVLVGCAQAPNDVVETSPAPNTTESETASSTEVEPSSISVPETESTESPATAQVPQRSGAFVSAEHPTQGTARLFSTPTGTVLEFDGDFQTDDGPDLVVVLHTAADVVGSTIPPAHPLQEGNYVTIAPLQSIQGVQRYAIPDTVDPSTYQSVAIWCQRFNATFGAAPLN